MTWTSRSSTLFFSALNGIAYGAGMFVAISDAGSVARSPDGVTWTNGGPLQSGGSINRSATTITYGNGYFLAGYYAVGEGSSILVSTDGVFWSPVWHHQFEQFKAAAFGDGAFVCTPEDETMFSVSWLPEAGLRVQRPRFSSRVFALGTRL